MYNYLEWDINTLFTFTLNLCANIKNELFCPMQNFKNGLKTEETLND